LNSLIDTTITSSVSDLITDRILTSSYLDEDSSSVETRFFSDTNSDPDALKEAADGTVLNIAIIDADLKSLAMSKTAFEGYGATVFAYNSGQSFLADYQAEKFNLVVLDVVLPDNSGLNILNQLRREYNSPPVIVYSPPLQREWVVKILQSGAKTYIVKPQKPNMLVQKSLGLLKGEF
jgi:CheY-like chemotaxis protein